MFSNIINFLKNRQLPPVLIAFCASVLFIALPSYFKIALSRLTVSSVYYPFTYFDNFLTDVAGAKKSNVELNRHLIEMSMKAAQYTEDHYENVRLRRMLNFDLQIPYRLVPVEVIGAKPGSMIRTIEVNAGSKRGVAVNMPVVSADGIVGKVITVTGDAAWVQLLLDHNCRVSVIDQRTRAMGIVRWSGGRFLDMGDVPIESQVAVGDTIVSSGLGGIFPTGLIVGTVVGASDPKGSLFKNIKVESSVDFSSLEEVFVVVYGE